jgi:hypothetical protein
MRYAAPLAAVALALAACSGGGGPGDGLTPDGALGSWKRTGEQQVFDGATLYGHINGGAEVFLELGFDRLEVQSFVSDAGEVAVEVYHMADPAAALGIYLMKCGEESPDPSLAPRHTVGPYQLQLVHGATYLVVNTIDGDGVDARTLIDLAAELVGRMPPAAPAAGVLAPLPTEGRVAGSERIIRGPFTLEAVYTLGEGDVLQLDSAVTAVAADYTNEEHGQLTLIVAPYPDEAAAAAAFANLVENLDPYLERLEGDATHLVFEDYSDRYGHAELDGPTIRIRVNLDRRPG